jgi:hypothetical protein
VAKYAGGYRRYVRDFNRQVGRGARRRQITYPFITMRDAGLPPAHAILRTDALTNLIILKTVRNRIAPGTDHKGVFSQEFVAQSFGKRVILTLAKLDAAPGPIHAGWHMLRALLLVNASQISI